MAKRDGRRNNDFEDLTEQCPEICGGERVAKGTRVPVRMLSEFLRAGDSISVVCQQYPTVDAKLIWLLARLS